MTGFRGAETKRLAARSAIGLCLLFVLTVLATHAAAEELGITATEPGLPVSLTGSYGLSSLTPFSHISAGEPFSRIRAGGLAFEIRNAAVRWDAQGRPQVVNQNLRRALLGTVIPGSGSLMAGRTAHGITELFSLGYLVANGFTAANDGDDAARDYWNLLARYEAENEHDQKLLLQTQTEMAHARWELRDDHRKRENILIGSYAGLFVIESWWLNRPLETRHRGWQLVLDVPRLSRGKAFFASFVFPGMGQAYRGQQRSAVYIALETYLLQEVLDSYARKEVHGSDHRLLESHLAADGLDAGEQNELSEIWDKRQKATHELQLFAGLAGAVWLVNILDILASHPEMQAPHPDGRFSVGRSPAGLPALQWTRSF